VIPLLGIAFVLASGASMVPFLALLVPLMRRRTQPPQQYLKEIGNTTLRA
jgi:hypothetical protein